MEIRLRTSTAGSVLAKDRRKRKLLANRSGIRGSWALPAAGRRGSGKSGGRRYAPRDAASASGTAVPPRFVELHSTNRAGRPSRQPSCGQGAPGTAAHQNENGADGGDVGPARTE